MGHVQVETLVNTLHRSLSEKKAETPGDTLRDVQAEALPDTQADRLEELKAVKVGETIIDVKGASLL